MSLSARDGDADDAIPSNSQSSSSGLGNKTVHRSNSCKKPPDSAAAMNEQYHPSEDVIEVDKRVPPDTRSAHVRPLKSILRNSSMYEHEDRTREGDESYPYPYPYLYRSFASDPKGKGKAKEYRTDAVESFYPPFPSDSQGRDKGREQSRKDDVNVYHPQQSSDSKGKAKANEHYSSTREDPYGWKTPLSQAEASSSLGGDRDARSVKKEKTRRHDQHATFIPTLGYKVKSGMAGPRPPTPGIIMRDPTFQDEFAPAKNRYSDRSRHSQSDTIHAKNLQIPKIQVKTKLSELLACGPSHYPSIDWDVTLPVPLAKKWTVQGYCVPLSKADLCLNAVDPPVSELFIFTAQLNSPLSVVLDQWGPIHIQVLPSLTIQDILQGIHRYFSKCLTLSDVQELDDGAVERVFGSRHKRSIAARKTDSDRANVIASTEPLRADELDGYLNYAGLEMDSDFPQSKTLYLKFENRTLKRRREGW